MKLRTRILIVTFFIILFVQGINCFLEIGFLFNNFEKKSINKYIIVGNEIKRKLDKSLTFGKPLTHINYKRLIASIIPSDVHNLHVADEKQTIVYSKNELQDKKKFPFFQELTQLKTSEFYQVFIPLSNKSEVLGNVIIIIPNKKIVAKLSDLIKKSLINFLIIVIITLPVLFVLLTIFINTPYNNFIHSLEKNMAKERYDKLNQNRIDLSHIFDVEAKIKEIRKGDWLLPENKSLYDPFVFFEKNSNNAPLKNKLFKKFLNMLNTNS